MSKKRKNAWQGLSIVILVVILGIFFYVNLHGDEEEQQISKTETLLTKFRTIIPISPLEWSDTDVKMDVIDGVFYGNPDDLDKPIVLADSGQYENLKLEESDEGLVNFDSIKNPRIKHIADFDPNYRRYIKDGPESKYMRVAVKDALLKMLDYLPANLGIIYTEGYVSPATYMKRIQEYYNDQYFETQGITPEQRYKVVSILLPRAYLTGAAVSIALFDVNTGKMLELDNTMEMGYRNQTFSPDATEEHRKNRLILLEAAIKAGFVNYGMMWWSFVINEKIHSYVRYNKVYKYGYVDFDIETQKQKPYIFATDEDIVKELEKNKVTVKLPDAVEKSERDLYAKINPEKIQITSRDNIPEKTVPVEVKQPDPVVVEKPSVVAIKSTEVPAKNIKKIEPEKAITVPTPSKNIKAKSEDDKVKSKVRN